MAATKIAEAFVEIGSKKDKMDAGLKSARSGLLGFVRKLAPIAAGIGAALGVKTALSSIQTQIDAEKKLEAVLKATGFAAGLSAKEIKDFAAARQDLTNFGDEATIAVSGVLATFKEIKGDIFKDAIVSIQDMSAVLGTDMQGSAIQLGKALNDPIAGISALSRVGVSFTEQQKEQIKALQESGDTMGAQQIILNELKSEFGGAAEAMVTPMIQLSNTIGDVAENIGSLLLPTVNLIAKAFKNLLGPAANARDVMESLGKKIAFTFANLGTMVELELAKVVLAALRMFPELEEPAGKAIATIAGLFAGMEAGFMANVRNIGKAWELLVKNFKSGSSFMGEVFDFFVLRQLRLAVDALGLITDAMSNLPETITFDDIEFEVPAKAFADAFKKKSKEVADFLEGEGGLTKATENRIAELEKILDDARKAAERRPAVEARRPGVPEPALSKETKKSGAEGIVEGITKAERGFGFSGIAALSQQIQQSIGKKQDRAAEETAKATKESAKLDKQNEKHLADISEKIGTQVAVLG